ncbi:MULTISPECIES: MFS transporter [Prauserella salsuginis group]|uniref:MFS transporter n=1 Tax=Prauserella salsuginis TaxID=387889 RepID=A0ABW6FW77_9PSEU|nr:MULTISPECIES: MFS transporter [Prauserella salsuginis group]MCR3720238.1 Transmembrane secretion effector [Prauserella flava]MCR3734053.1 Transmembrane secretion effector [Prauserella salsuginis]
MAQDPTTTVTSPAPARRGLSLLLGANLAANLGDGIAKVAFPLLAATVTRDPVLIAGLSAAQFLPWLLLAVLAGAMLDRVDRRKAIVLANTGRAVAIAGMTVLVLTDSASIWLVYLGALVVGVAEVVADSAANVLIPSVVDQRGLSGANSKLQATEIVGQTFAGGPLGSLTFAVFAAFPFLLTSASFAIGAALLLALAGSFRPQRSSAAGGEDRPAATLRSDLADGMRWLIANPIMWRLVVAAGGLALTSELAQAQLVLYALEDLSLTEAAFGVFGLVGGLGGLAGAAVASRLIDRFRGRYVLAGSMATAGAAFVAMGFSAQPVVSAVLFGVFAGAVVVANVLLATTRHRLVPADLLGRVLGVWRTVVWGMLPVGALLGGLLTTVLGSTSATFAFSGACQIALGVVTVVAVLMLGRRPGTV